MAWCAAFGCNNDIPKKAVTTYPERRKILPKIKIDQNTVQLLEELALVKFSNEEGVKAMETIINFVDPIREVNTEGVEPLISVLEESSLYLREDKEEEMDRELILMNASKLEEDYFVAPPGNIPFSSDDVS